jgi:O-antigen/teichoic acid export membrane protein
MRMYKDSSLKKRYAFKLATNFVGMIASLVIQAIIPRGLGPKAYGDFNYLTSFFTQVTGFLDMGTSLGFYTKLSQRQEEKPLVTFYFLFILLVFLLCILLVTMGVQTSYYQEIWPGQSIIFIYLAAIWGLLTWLLQIFQKMADAYGLTVYTELVNIIQKSVGILLILFLFIISWINLATLFIYYYLVIGLIIITYIFIMRRGGYLTNLWKILDAGRIKSYIKEFYDFSHPLFILSFVSLICGIFDRWTLQKFAGSVQQGFYGLSYQIGAGCFIFTSAMTPLLIREFSIAFAKNDLKHMAYLFRRYIPILYSIAAYFAVFIAIQADKVIYIMGGKHFSKALVAVTIMAFYPIFQSYGQLSGAVFYASGQTPLYRNIGMVFLLGGLPLTYFLIAPGDKLGLNAGATGLALKMVVIQVAAINVQLYFNAKFLGLRFWRYVGHQFVSVGCLLVLALAARLLVERMGLFQGGLIMSFLLSGVIYSVMVILMAYSQPVIFGVTRQDIHHLLRMVGEQTGLY